MLTTLLFMEQASFVKQARFSSLNVSPITAFFTKSLNELFANRYEIHLCYEACYVRYSLCRFLRKDALHCDVIAPSQIPVKAGVRVKTDRLDALKLAEYYAKDLRSPVYVPDKTDEEVRDILRSRNFLVRQRKMLKTHILSACKRFSKENSGTFTGKKDIFEKQVP